MRVIHKMALVLDQFVSASDGCLSLGELATATRMPKSTVHRICSALDAERMVERDGMRYGLGARLALWGLRARGLAEIRRAALPELERLRDETGETASLYMRCGAQRVCVERVESCVAVGRSVRVGEALPLRPGSAGKVLLAYAAPAAAGDVSVPPAGEPLAETELDAVRDRGWAVSFEERERGAASVSVPVWGERGLVAALSVSGPVPRLSRTRVPGLVSALLEASARVTDWLGAEGVRR